VFFKWLNLCVTTKYLNIVTELLNFECEFYLALKNLTRVTWERQPTKSTGVTEGGCAKVLNNKMLHIYCVCSKLSSTSRISPRPWFSFPAWLPVFLSFPFLIRGVTQVQWSQWADIYQRLQFLWQALIPHSHCSTAFYLSHCNLPDSRDPVPLEFLPHPKKGRKQTNVT
jgi:hypothetical protein